jgi:Secretion system C-terminal sorting domain
MKPINRLILFLLFAASFHLPTNAQMRMTYTLGCFGATGDTSARVTESVLIGYNSCFDFSNGLPKFTIPNTGAFNISCLEEFPKIPLEFKAYPNPVTNELHVKSVIHFPEVNRLAYFFTITDITGRVLKRFRTDLNAINTGLSIPVETLPVGYYTITLYAEKELIQSFKILKADHNG